VRHMAWGLRGACLAFILSAVTRSVSADGLFSDDPSPAEMAAYGRQITAAQESLKVIEQYAQMVHVQQMQSGNCDPAFEIESKRPLAMRRSNFSKASFIPQVCASRKTKLRLLSGFTRAADQNYPEANRILGLLYEVGIRGVPVNANAAATYMAKAANAGMQGTFKRSRNTESIWWRETAFRRILLSQSGV
jgi:hypothetical protein